MKTLKFIVACLVSLSVFFLYLAGVAKADGVIDVWPTGSDELEGVHPSNPSTFPSPTPFPVRFPCTKDLENVQNAIFEAAQTGERVLLHAKDESGIEKAFNFGYHRIPPERIPAAFIYDDVEILGETGEDGEPLTKITGGEWTFFAPLPEDVNRDEGPSEPGPNITIKNIHFDGAFRAPIHFAYTSGVLIENNKITNVIPYGPIPQFYGLEYGYWTVGAMVTTLATEENSSEATVVPNAITGCLVFKDNELDLDIHYPFPAPELPALPPQPETTMGHGILISRTWGTDIKIKGNTIANVSWDSIEITNNYADDTGQGSITIAKNKIFTPDVGFPFPGQTTPLGIYTGWASLDPSVEFPEESPDTVIRENFIEGHADASIGIISSYEGQIVRKNEIIVGDTSGASGIQIVAEKCIAAQNNITVKHTSGVPGQGGTGWGVLIVSDEACVIMNKITFDGESPANAILQIASKGLLALNSVKGSGNSAILLYTGLGGPEGVTYYTAENNLILWNDYREFEAGLADVGFVGMGPGMGASNNTLVAWWGGTVYDMGIGNEIDGNWEILE